MLALRSGLYQLWFYASMLVMGLAFAPAAAVSRPAAVWAMKAFCVQALWVLERLCGLRVEIRGPVPDGPAVIAAKHQSFLDVVILMRTLPEPRFVMKRSLLWAPILGLYALRIGAVAIDREQGAAALRALKRRLGAERSAQIVIYPQGTRTPPDATTADYPYKGGAALLARASGLPTIPVATNAGLFWGRASLLRRPGVAVLEFLPALEAGLPTRGYLAALETAIEPAADRLRAEGGGRASDASPAPPAA
ncbi:MAG: lysophospholipid acyltransferase family protein [Pseudomonadota bacterium]